MSRYYVEFEGWPEEIKVIVGWDAPLETFFTQIEDTRIEDEDDQLLLWLGTYDQITTLEELERRINDEISLELPYGELPEEIVQALEEDQNEE